MDGDKGSVAMQGLFHERALQDVSALRDFDLSGLKKDEFQIEFNPYVRMGDLSKDGRMAIVATQVGPELGLSNRRVRLYDVDARTSRNGFSNGGGAQGGSYVSPRIRRHADFAAGGTPPTGADFHGCAPAPSSE